MVPAEWTNDTSSWWDLASTETYIDATSTSPPRSDFVRCEVLMEFIINFLCAGLLCTVGFVGNSVSYAVLGHDGEILPVARFLLRSLAVADNIFLALWFFNFSLKDLFAYTGVDKNFDAVGWLYVRMALYPLLFVGQTATIWLTVLVAASRCLAVCWPCRAAIYCTLAATRKGVVAAAVFSVAYNLPR